MSSRRGSGPSLAMQLADEYQLATGQSTWTTETLREWAKIHRPHLLPTIDPDVAINRALDAFLQNGWRQEVDQKGRRVMLSAKLGDGVNYGHRDRVSWQIRQAYIKEQRWRAFQFNKSVDEDIDYLQRHRKKGEPKFQTEFDFVAEAV